jgi:hypothetical protein
MPRLYALTVHSHLQATLVPASNCQTTVAVGATGCVPGAISAGFVAGSRTVASGAQAPWAHVDYGLRRGLATVLR